MHQLDHYKVLKYLTEIGLNNVPEELYTDETIGDGLDQNDNIIETSEIIESDLCSLRCLYLPAMVGAPR